MTLKQKHMALMGDILFCFFISLLIPFSLLLSLLLSFLTSSVSMLDVFLRDVLAYSSLK